MRRRTARFTDGDARQDLLAHRLAGGILRGQHRLARFLNDWARQCSKGALVWGFVLFALAFGACCLYLLITALN